MRESFGSDGQPGSYSDIDVTDCLFIVGHNVAATQTVLWSRMLDRIHSANPPQVIVMDPRRSATAEAATVHLRPRIGTNVAVLNGLQHLLIRSGAVNAGFVTAHTVGYDELCKVVEKYTPQYVEEISGIPAAQLVQVSTILGSTRRLVSSCLQGVYQSNQATAAACQINNLHLLLGLIGQAGSGVLQMNGQPTAQNNRETGCNGEYPGFRNPGNPQHMQEICRHWRIPLSRLPHWAESPTHIMEMLRFIEQDSLQLLWVIGTNPLVSLPELDRVRRLLTKPSLFLVVQDAFMTETAQLADLVLPAAMWAEKTGSFTNADRTVHLSMKAVEPPGQARSDLDIFLLYAERMDFRDQDGHKLLQFSTPEEAFDDWKKSSLGRPCDYSGLSYAKLTGGSGVQWPCNAESSPDGTERLFSDWHFFTDVDYCESYGHDLQTGSPLSEAEYRQLNPAGRAILKSCHYRPAEEEPDADYPLRLSTGRQVHHFHTRTKTGRDRHLNAGSGNDAFVQVSQADAARYQLASGDMCLVSSRRGQIQVRCEVGDIEDGQVFIPFHYGYWDSGDGRARAANELTVTSWDSVSKQPMFKGGAVQIRKANGVVLPEHQTAAIDSASRKSTTNAAATETTTHRHLIDAVLSVHSGISQLLHLYDRLIVDYNFDQEVRNGLKTLNTLAVSCKDRLAPFFSQYADNGRDERRNQAVVNSQQTFIHSLFPPGRFETGTVSRSYVELRDMQHLYMVLQQLTIEFTSLTPVAAALQDTEMTAAVEFIQHELHRQTEWALNKVKTSSMQTLVVPVPIGK